MLEVILIIITTIVTAFLSLTGGFLLLSGSKFAAFFKKYGTMFAALVLTYAVFGDIIPEVLEEGALPVWQVALYVVLGVLICSIVGFLAGHFHRHGEDKHFKDKKQAYTMLVVDSLHTAMDGIVIGTSFAAGIPTGLVSASATAAHEIPQEIGDFSIMIRSKIGNQKIARLQIVSALILVPFALISYFIGDMLEPAMPTLLSFIAGFFLYIALNEIWSIIKAIWTRAKKASPKAKEIK